ncbi:hypothetical protein RM96_31130 [Cupriavidus sp. IDO]|nr:hypothetical protein RM96_31130 [Cupriavidus sp. IDO]
MAWQALRRPPAAPANADRSVHRWHYTGTIIHSNLRGPQLFPFLQIIVNARLEINRLQFSVSLSYKVMDPMTDFR